MLESIRPYFGSVPTSGHFSVLPPFPWPPPKWSFKEALPKTLVAPASANLGEVSANLVSALRTASQDFDYGFFGVPDGFVLLARLERITPDGTPLPGRDSWNPDPLPARTLNDYLMELFFSPPGYFRVIAFIVARDEPMESNAKSHLPDISGGAKHLPDEVAKQPFADHDVYALVYTFRRYAGGQMELDYPGLPSGFTHIRASGIWSALQQQSRSN